VEPEWIGPVNLINRCQGDHEQRPVGIDAVRAPTRATGGLHDVVGEIEGDTRGIADGGGVDDLLEIVPQKFGPQRRRQKHSDQGE